MSLSTTIKSIQDIMRKDAGVDGDAQRISQLCWMLFLKIFDAREDEWELERDDYQSPIPERLRWRNWAADDEGITGEDLLDFVNNQLFPQLKKLPARDGQALVVRSVFEDAYNYMKNGTLIRQVLNKSTKSTSTPRRNVTSSTRCTRASCGTCRAPGMPGSSTRRGP